VEKILNQDEIDALLRAARHTENTRAEHHAPADHAVPFAFGRGTGITAPQLGVINQLHEAFARQVTQRVSASLRAMFDVTLVSVEQLVFTDFLQQIGERSYLASIQVQPLEATALLELDLPTAWPIIDLLLGGEGKAECPARDLTEIEGLILQSVIQIIIQELETVWQNFVNLKFGFERRQQQADVVRLLPSSERVLAISLEVQIPERRGTLTFAFPASVSGALLRSVSDQSLTRKRQVTPDSLAARRRRLERCRFALEMKLPESALTAEELLSLERGQILVLRHRVEDPLVLTVANRQIFAAYPVRAHHAKAALIESRLLSPADPVKEMS
jgi:flagellar motor switch protein FliM